MPMHTQLRNQFMYMCVLMCTWLVRSISCQGCSSKDYHAKKKEGMQHVHEMFRDAAQLL